METQLFHRNDLEDQGYWWYDKLEHKQSQSTMGRPLRSYNNRQHFLKEINLDTC